MIERGEFYTYLWLREDGTPYYVGKGSGQRAFTNKNHLVNCPQDISNIILQEWPTEEDAFAAEKFLISYYGRLDLRTGCLRNLADGGQNPPRNWGNKFLLGHRHSEETRRKISKAGKGRHKSNITKRKMSAAKKGKKRMPFSSKWKKNMSEAHKRSV